MTRNAPAIIVSYVEPGAIDVLATYHLALTGAELVSPLGQISRAATIDRETPAPTFGGLPPQVGVGVFGGSGGIGLGTGLGFPLGGSAPPPSPLIRAKARVPVENLGDYRDNWQRYVVRLRFGQPPGDTSVADMPAPEPR